MVLTNESQTLGNYEKQVYLELDNELSQAEIWYALSVDRLGKKLSAHIVLSYSIGVSTTDCINSYLALLNLPLHKCDLEGVAVLGYN